MCVIVVSVSSNTCYCNGIIVVSRNVYSLFEVLSNTSACDTVRNKYVIPISTHKLVV